MERGPPWEVKFFGETGAFWEKVYVGTLPPPSGGSPPLSGEAF